MACTTSVVHVSYEEPAIATSSGADSLSERVPHRRRHSSYQARTFPAEYDDIQLLVDRFIAELGQRLDFLETYGHLKLDHGIERAYSTLTKVRDSCSHVSDEFIGAGRRRANILVDILEDQYKGALARKVTMEQKVQEGVRLMETILADFEARAYAMRDSRLAAAETLLDQGRKRVDEGLERARGVVGDAKEKALRARETVRMKIEDAIERARKHGLIAYEDLPDPWKVNPHIIRGYRFSETWHDCIRSMLGVSNESFNIWSHLLGFVGVLSIAFYFYPTSITFSRSTNSDIFIAAVFLFAACKCLACSTLWHTMSSIASQNIMERFACVDYTGISLLVATSIMTTEYTAFYCEPISRWTYMLTTAALGCIGTIAPWHPAFNRNDKAWLRVAFYVGLSATGFLPIAQLIFTRGLSWALTFYAPITKSIAVYLTGALLYASRTPERWFPGMFDYVGGSHNIWHLAVLGGILFHYSAMQEFFQKAFIRAQSQCSVY